MKKLLPLLLLISASVHAAGLEFPVATQRTDNTKLDVSEIKGHKVYCGTASGTYDNWAFFAGATAPKTTIETIPFLKIGTNYCILVTVDVDGRESDKSEEFVLEVTANTPPPPTAVTAKIIKSVLVTFTPPAAKGITAYKYFARNGLTGEEITAEFPNTGNMTEFNINLPEGKYALCMYAKTTVWSKRYSCALINITPPTPPKVCK